MQDNARPINPYLCGVLAGLVLVLSVVWANKFPGASTTFVRIAGYAEAVVAPQHVADNTYFQSKGVKVDWQMLYLAGILLGSAFIALASRQYRCQAVPEMWKAKFGPSAVKRAFAALLGGFICIVGARLAGGCPTGHGLSGLSQMSVSGFVTLGAIIVGGIIMAALLYRGCDEC